jgi:hypothetical protein
MPPFFSLMGTFLMVIFAIFASIAIRIEALLANLETLIRVQRESKSHPSPL